MAMSKGLIDYRKGSVTIAIDNKQSCFEFATFYK